MADPQLIPVPQGFNPFGPGPTAEPQLVPVAPGFNPFEPASPSAEEPTPQGPKSYKAGEVPEEFIRNFAPSLIKELGGMWEGAKALVTEPHKVLPELASTAISAMDALPSDPKLRQAFLNHIAEKQGPEAAERRAKSVERWDAVRNALSESYGDWEAIKRTAAEEPAKLLLDLSTILSGGAMATAKVPGVAKALNTAATITDPVSLTAKGVTKIVEPAVSARLGVHTGTGAAPLQEAARAGYEGGETAKNFWKAYNNGVPAEDIVASAEQGINNIKQRMQQIYEVRKNDPRHGWSNDPNTLDFAPVEKAWKDTVNSLTTKSGKLTVGDAEWNQIQKVGEVVAEWEKDIKSGAIKGTADDFDGLKRRIRAIYPDGEAPQLRRVTTKMANAVDAEIKRQTPGYHTAMKDYSAGMTALDNLKAAFSLNDKASVQTQMSQLQSVMRNNANTQYGHRTAKLDELEHEGGVSLRPQLAGSALNSWEPRGLARIGSIGADTAGATMLFGPLAGAATAATSALTSSPKITGGAYHLAGRAAGLPDAMARFLPAKVRPRPGYFWRTFDRNPRLGARLVGELQPDEEERKRGGYFRVKRQK